MEQVQFTQNDRDAIIALKLEVKGLSNTVKNIDNKLDNDVYVKKIEYVKSEEDNDTAHNDYELRLRRLELWGGMVAGALFLIEFLSK